MKIKPRTLRMLVGMAVMLAAFGAMGRFLKATTEVKIPHEDGVRLVDACERIEGELEKLSKTLQGAQEALAKEAGDAPDLAARKHQLEVDTQMCAAKSKLVGYVKHAAAAEVIVKKEWNDAWSALVATAPDFETDRDEDVSRVAGQLKVPGMVGMKVPKGMVYFLGYMKLMTGLPKS